MLVLQDCIEKLSAFKHEFGRQFGITKLGIFGSVNAASELLYGTYDAP